jgi:hypothetical protein
MLQSFALHYSGLYIIIIIILLLFFFLTANGFLPGDNVYTIRHKKQHTSHKITPRSNETQHTKIHTHNKGHTTQNEYK